MSEWSVSVIFFKVPHYAFSHITFNIVCYCECKRLAVSHNEFFVSPKKRTDSELSEMSRQ